SETNALQGRPRRLAAETSRLDVDAPQISEFVFIRVDSWLIPDPLTVRGCVFTFLPYGSDNYFPSDKKASGMDRTGRRANRRVPRPVHSLAPRTGARR